MKFLFRFDRPVFWPAAALNPEPLNSEKRFIPAPKGLNGEIANPRYVSVPSWPEERAQFIKDIDPWDHLITGHELHEWSYRNSSVVDFSSLQNNGSSNRIGFMASVKGTVKNFMKMKRYPGYLGSLRGKSFHDLGLIVWNSPSKPHPHCNECIWNAKWQEPGMEESHRRDLWDGITGGMSIRILLKTILSG
ncbi:MAG: hypothetical protein GY850_41765 [bacterium]|nr:hypothetical protein [bacterium]